MTGDLLGFGVCSEVTGEGWLDGCEEGWLDGWLDGCDDKVGFDVGSEVTGDLLGFDVGEEVNVSSVGELDGSEVGDLLGEVVTFICYGND